MPENLQKLARSLPNGKAAAEHKEQLVTKGTLLTPCAEQNKGSLMIPRLVILEWGGSEERASRYPLLVTFLVFEPKYKNSVNFYDLCLYNPVYI